MVIAVAFILFALFYWFGYFVLKESLIKKFHSFILPFQKEKPSKTKKFFWLYFIVLCLMIHYLCQYLSVGSFENIFFQNYNMNLSRNYISLPFQFIRGLFNTIYFVSSFLSLWLLFCYSVEKNCTLEFILAGILLFISSTGLYLTGFRTYPVLLVAGSLILFCRHWLLQRKLCKRLFVILILFILYSTLVMPLVDILRPNYKGFVSSFERIKNIDIVTHYKDFFMKKLMRKLDTLYFEKYKQDFAKQEKRNIPTVTNSGFLINNPSSGSQNETKSQNKAENLNLSQYDLEKKKLLMDYIGGGHHYSQQIAWQLMVFPKYIDFLGIKALFEDYMAILPKPICDLFSIEKKISIGTYVASLKGWKKGSQPSGPFGEGYVCFGFCGGYLAMMFVSFCCGLLGKIAVYGLFINDRDDEFQVFSLVCLLASPFMITVGMGLLIPAFYGIVIILLGHYFVTKISNLIQST
jgi:hypothetical protein